MSRFVKSMLNQTIQNPLDGIESVNPLGSGRAPTLEYIPYSTKNKNDEKTKSLKKRSCQLPEVRNRREFGTFQGTKRAFMASREHAAKVAQKVLDKNWEQQEKIRSWNFKQQTRAIEANIRVRKQSSLGDTSHKKLKIYGVVNTTTGPRPPVKLPPDIQVTEYPNHTRYWG